jgi:hypothetical protein
MITFEQLKISRENGGKNCGDLPWHHYSLKVPGQARTPREAVAIHSLLKFCGDEITNICKRSGLTENDQIVWVREFWPHGKGWSEASMRRGIGGRFMEAILEEAVKFGARAAYGSTCAPSMKNFLSKDPRWVLTVVSGNLCGYTRVLAPRLPAKNE